MKKFILLSLVFIASLLAPAINAQPQAPQSAEREQWMSEMRQYKRNYFTKELDLSRDQQNKFFPLYEEMENQTFKINEEARLMEKRVSEMPDPTDLEYEKATDAIYETKMKEAELEKEYLQKFKTILNKKQMFRLKAVERQFSRDMMRQHNRLRNRRADK